MNWQEKETLQHAIAHLNGYALIVKARTGYNPVAVDNCIKKLRKMVRK